MQVTANYQGLSRRRKWPSLSQYSIIWNNSRLRYIQGRDNFMILTFLKSLHRRHGLSRSWMTHPQAQFGIAMFRNYFTCTFPLYKNIGIACKHAYKLEEIVAIAGVTHACTWMIYAYGVSLDAYAYTADLWNNKTALRLHAVIKYSAVR